MLWRLRVDYLTEVSSLKYLTPAPFYLSLHNLKHKTYGLIKPMGLGKISLTINIRTILVL